MSAARDVLADVMASLCEMMGAHAGAIGPDSRFFADLGLGSVDLIVLSDRLDERYAVALGFVEALPALAQAGYDDVTIRQLAALVELQLRSVQGSS